MAAPFDRVLLKEAGEQLELSLSEFLSLPLHVRVSAVLQRAVDFYAGPVSVDRQEALKYLRSRRVAD